MFCHINAVLELGGTDAIFHFSFDSMTTSNLYGAQAL